MDATQIEEKYSQMSWEFPPMTQQTFEMCLARLETRGLIASGTGDTDFDALYDLLGGLYVVPLSGSLPLRIATFLKLIFSGTPIAKAKLLFRHDKPNEREAQVLSLSRQALLSTVELIKCAESGVSDISTGEKIMKALYNDDNTISDNILRGFKHMAHMNNWPSVLLRRWLLQGLTGVRCLLVGAAMFLTVQDRILLAISGLLGVFTVLYSITLYRLIDKREYEVVEGAVPISGICRFVGKGTLYLLTADGAEQTISLDRQTKIQIGNCCRAYISLNLTYPRTDFLMTNFLRLKIGESTTAQKRNIIHK